MVPRLAAAGCSPHCLPAALGLVLHPGTAGERVGASGTAGWPL